MTTEKMTVHKALSELKTLDDRIEKKINATEWVFVNKHTNQTVKGRPIAQYCADIKAEYQSLCDLMKRREAIKREVVKSNAVTEVVVAGKTYTVAEAIEIKNHGLPIKRLLLEDLTESNSDAEDLAQSRNGSQLEQRADEYIKSLYGSTDMKNLSADVKTAREEFIKSQTTDVVDPIGAKDEIRRLEEEISSFEVEIDSALSVSNALTEITIEY